MAHLRGRDLIDAQAFIRDGYGALAHDRVVAALPPEARDIWTRPLQPVSWYPIEALRLYLRAARELLDPGSQDFFFRQGCDAARRQRAGPIAGMVATANLRMRLAPVVWRMYYDVGRLEVVGTDPETALSRIHGFPASPELCERFRGIWVGMTSTDAKAVRIEESRCVLRGDPYCELRWLP
jgi:hypothetical protein